MKRIILYSIAFIGGSAMLSAMESIRNADCNALNAVVAQILRDPHQLEQLEVLPTRLRVPAQLLLQSRNNKDAALLKALKENKKNEADILIACGASKEYVYQLMHDLEMYGIKYLLAQAIRQQDVTKLQLLSDAGLESVRESFQPDLSLFTYALRVEANDDILRILMRDSFIGFYGDPNAPFLFLREVIKHDAVRALQLLLAMPEIEQYLNEKHTLLRGATPLVYAIFQNSAKVVQLLLQDMRVNVNEKIHVPSSTQPERTPLDMILIFFPQEVGKRLAALLVRRGDSDSNTLLNGKTLLEYAVGRGDPELVALLLHHGRPHSTTIRAALEAATQRNDAALITVLSDFLARNVSA